MAEASGWLIEARGAVSFCGCTPAGCLAPWDAPYALRAQYADEEDPPPPAWLAPEWRELSGDIDPDELLGLSHAYAGQVSLWDACLGSWLEEFRAHRLARNTLLVFLSPRGYPLGEHRHVGRVGPDLYSESVQLAWWWRFPDGLGAPARTPALVLPADLSPTIAEWLDWPAAARRDRRTQSAAAGPLGAIAAARGGRADRRPGTVGAADTGLASDCQRRRASRAVELYAKPGDRYEVNDVAIRAPEICAGLGEQLQRARSQPTAELSGLDAALVTVVD